MTSKHYGRTTRNFRALAARTKAAWRARDLPCCECSQAIDWDAPRNSADEATLAHALPVSTHPHLAEDPGNIKGIAHRGCNSSAGTGEGMPALGQTSHQW